MNGNIFNYSLVSDVSEQYTWNCGWFGCDSVYAIPPNPPASIFTQSYINAYNTAFNQPNKNYQAALYQYFTFTYSDVNSNFIPGTFGYNEQYNDQSNPSNSITIDYLQDDASVYDETPYLFISAGSGGGSGFMYLNWIIVTYGIPYIVNVS